MSRAALAADDAEDDADAARVAYHLALAAAR